MPSGRPPLGSPPRGPFPLSPHTRGFMSHSSPNHTNNKTTIILKDHLVGTNQLILHRLQSLQVTIYLGRVFRMMRRVVKVLPSGIWVRGGEQPGMLWQRAMATKLDGGTKSGVDESSPGANPAEREAFKSDMDSSYGDAYSTRSSDEGYGERYGEAVKVVLEKKQDTQELQRGATAERDQNEEAVKQVQYDTSQGEHVEEKEVARHSEKDVAFNDEHAMHKRQEEAHKSEGGRGGPTT